VSGITGVFSRVNQKITRQQVQRLMDVVPHRGTDGMAVWINENVALGHQLLTTTPESVNEIQPLLDKRSGSCIVFDGRLDNRSELFKKLGKLNYCTNPITDAEIVLKLFVKLGKKCLTQILGDFAFAIWDKRNERIFCARDIFGIKPFYYHVSNNIFIFGSEIRQVLEHPAVNIQPNEGMIAEYLSGHITSKNETLYRDVFRLPPAHFFVVDSNSFKKQRFWDMKPQERIVYKTDDEYAEHFIEVFGHAVRDRLRCNGTVGAYLSGGLDSSSIVGMASLLRDKGLQNEIKTFSLIFPGRDESDESKYIKSTSDKWNIKNYAISVTKFHHPDWEQQVIETFDIPDAPGQSMADPLMEKVASKDIHVMLSGIGGDELFSGSPYAYQDLLKSTQFMSVLKLFTQNSHHIGWAECKRLATDVLWPIIPKAIRKNLLQWRKNTRLPPWLMKSFIKQTSLQGRIKRADYGEMFSSMADSKIYRAVSSGWETHLFEQCDRYCLSYNLEDRYPYLDKRVVEFAIALPELQRRRWDGQNKHILRTAGKVLLAPMIRERVDKADFSFLFAESIPVSTVDKLFRASTLDDMGWVSNNNIQEYSKEMINAYENNDDYTRYMWDLWYAYSIQLWLNSVPFSAKIGKV